MVPARPARAVARGERVATLSARRLGWFASTGTTESPPAVTSWGHTARWVRSASPGTTRPAGGIGVSTALAAASSWPLPSVRTWAITAGASCASAATRCPPGAGARSTPRSVVPATATASGGRTPVRGSHAPSTRSNATTARARKMRWNVAAHGARPGGAPTASRSSGAASLRSRPHGAMAVTPVQPHPSAATATCSRAASGSGGEAPRHPNGRRGSGTVAKAAANDPGGAGGRLGNGGRLGRLPSPDALPLVGVRPATLHPSAE